MSYDVIDESFFSCSSSSISDQSFDSALSDDNALNLRDLISSTFSNCRKFFNAVHINAQSIPSHYSDLLSSFDSDLIHAVLVSETFLKPALPSTQYSLPGYKIVRNDRTGKGCGGVAIYLRGDITYKIIDQSPSVYSKCAEHLFLEIDFQHTKMLLGVFYSPSLQIDYFSSFEAKLENLSSQYDHTIILGDFNTCLLKGDSRSRKLQSIVSSVNMHLLPLNATHRAPHCTPSLLDLILVSDPNKVATHGQLPAPFSYHDLIYLSYKIRPPKRKAKFLFLRSFKNVNLEHLRADVGGIDWSPVLACEDIDTMVSVFNRTMLDLYEVHAPLKKVKVKHLPAPWLSPTIKNQMAKRDKAKRLYRKQPTEENWDLYKKLRNHCSRLCRDAKRRHIHNSINNCNPTQVWQFLKSLGLGKASSKSSSEKMDLNALNAHFSKSPVILDDHVKSSTLKDLSNLPLPTNNSFSFHPIAEQDIKKCIQSISSKAVGDDGLQLQMFLPIMSEIVPIIAHIVNFSLFTNSFPSAWKKAHVLPLPKVSNPTSPSQFRPISILPILSKVLESVVQKQLSHYLSSNSLLSPYQSGFRPGHSTVTTLVKITDDIRLAMENKCLTILVLLDFSSAFNSVDFDILLGILSSLNVSAPAIEWFKSYLRGRSQSVRSDEDSSDWCDLAAGVPQGGVLSPLLFSVFINAIIKVLTSNYHLYADDLQLYRHFKVGELAETVAAINNDLENINKWAKSFGLLLNPTKSQALIVGGRYMLSQLDHQSLPPVVYDSVPILYSKSAKNLGVHIDTKLSWDVHIADVSKRVFYSFQSLKRLQKFLPFHTKVTLAQSLLLPLIDYADVCFLDATEVLLNKLERLQNLCIRFIFGLRKYDHVSEFRAKLKWLPIRRRRDTHILSLLYTVLHNPNSPQYLRERFEYFVPRGKPCRTANSLLLRTPFHTSSRYDGSFSVTAVRLWNSLPLSIRDSPSLEIFKRRIKEHFLSQ
ncbi:hypothetical protein PYW08_001663 [Mythimna loreyi]|uniref:Uncharacterized protein n=1 Tax=Mythimna loreyi TaxID=667449 RepID=A0ACC2R7D0_9NEOP|nr:hypothetical protein PYW08_001663 [Mythimna loreyi]